MKKMKMCSSWNKSVEQPGITGYTHVVVVVVVVAVVVAVAVVAAAAAVVAAAVTIELALW